MTVSDSRRNGRKHWAFGLLASVVFGLALRAQEEAPESRPNPGSRPPVRSAQDVDAILREIDNLKKMVDGLKAEAPAPAQRPDGPGRPPREDRARDNRPTEPPILPESWTKELDWRSIGPAGMGGRITSISVFPQDPTTFFVATASGGLLKTSNGGVTFEHQFDKESTVSIGDVCVAPSSKDIVWIGTGEANPRNSVSYGDGVYKSTDGGKTWTNMGLRDSFQISRVVVHPTNPDIVYVGALGRLYGPNAERGLFKTTDGGKTWAKVHFIDENTGVIDIAMHPKDPETLIIATWERRRDGFDSHRGEPSPEEGHDGYDPVKKWGPGAGFFKTVDGGKNWKRLSNGLPSSHFGRTDIDWYQKDPNILYAIIDCQKIGMGPAAPKTWLGVTGEDIDGGGAKIREVTEKSPAAKAELKAGDILKALDGVAVASYADLQALLRKKSPGDAIKFDIEREGQAQSITVTLDERPLGQATGGRPTPYLGITASSDNDTVKVTEVAERSSAAKAGVKVGDIIRAADGEALDAAEQLTALVSVKTFGEKMRLEILRDKTSMEIVATIEERQAAPQRGAQAFAGRGGGGGGALGQFLGLAGEDQKDGIKVTRVADDRLGEKVGIMVDDVLQTVDGKPIESTDFLVNLIRDKKEGDKIVVGILRGQEKKDITIALEPPGGAQTRPFGWMYAGQAPNVQNQQGPNGNEYGGVYKSTDGGESWVRVNSINPRPMYFSQIRVDPSDDRYVYILGVSQHRSQNGGKTFTEDAGERVHADGHALWISPADGRHMIIGVDGGFYQSKDRTKTWEHLNHMAIGQFYHVAVDSRQPYRVYGGLQDNGSWGGPSRSLSNPGSVNADWFSIGGGDGFVCRVDPFDPDIVYSESQDGVMGRRNLKTGQSAGISPRPEPGKRYRFNWNTPYILSSHNAGIFYAAGNYVFRSLKRGEDLRCISPEITRTGRGSATALAESPINPNVLWVGTDDGQLWITTNGGFEWKSVIDKVGLPGPRWVATLEASRYAEGRCYVAFDAHRSDDDEPYVYVTEDFGQTWKSLRANLPRGSTRVLREDTKSEDLLFCGTEFAAYASISRGVSWTKINNDLPTVAVHEFAIHPTVPEMAVATHGRSVWILDISMLRQWTKNATKNPVSLYDPAPVVRWRSESQRATGDGHQHFFGQNPGRGARIGYSLAEAANAASIEIYDVKGEKIRELEAPKEAGLHVVTWDLARGREGAAGGGPGQPGAGRGGPTGPAGQAPGGGFRRREGESPAEGERPTSGPTSRESGEGPATRPFGRREGFGRGEGAGRGEGEGQGGRRRRFPRQEGEGPTSRPTGDADSPFGRRGEPRTEGEATTQPTTRPTTEPTTQPTSAPSDSAAAGPRGPGGGGRGQGRFGGFGGVPSGVYKVVLKVDGKEYVTTIRIDADPTLPPELAAELDAAAVSEDEHEEEEEEGTEKWIFLDKDEIDD